MFCLLFAMPPTERVIGKWQKTSSLDAPPSTGLTFTFSSIYKIKCEIKLLHMCLRGPHALQLYGDKEVWGVDSFNPIQSMEINLGPSLMSSRNQHQGLIFFTSCFHHKPKKEGLQTTLSPLVKFRDMGNGELEKVCYLRAFNYHSTTRRKENKQTSSLVPTGLKNI